MTAAAGNMSRHEVPGDRRSLFALVMWAAGALIAVCATLDDPGLTVDEPINVGHGKALVATMLSRPADLVRAEGVIRIWGHAHEHPPLTRLFVGLAHAASDPDPTNPTTYEPRGGRSASAVALAVIVFFCARAAWRMYGPVAGFTGGLAVVFMPRVFAHAHFASPELISAAFVLTAVLSAGWARIGYDTLTGFARWRRLILAGAILGMALLTKLTAALVPLSIAAAWLVRWRVRAILPLVVWGACGLAVFIAGWPWLWPFDLPDYPAGWLGTVRRLQDFAFVGVQRETIYTWYFGRQAPTINAAVPWHFVWVYFFVTVPVGLHALGCTLGLPKLVTTLRSPSAAAEILSTIAVTLLVFSLPIHRYDGERLFLFVFPLWAIVIGVGGAVAFEMMTRRLGQTIALAGLCALLIHQAYGVVSYHPFQLSYYNLLVGGLPGAERLGLEVTYWGDTVTDDFLDEFSARAGRGAFAALLPTLYDRHAWMSSTPELARNDQAVVPGHLLKPYRCRWAIVFHRQGYLHDPLPQAVLHDGELVAEIAHAGVWLTRLYRLTPETPTRDSTDPIRP